MDESLHHTIYHRDFLTETIQNHDSLKEYIETECNYTVYIQGNNYSIYSRESTGESGPVREKGEESTEQLNESHDFSKRRDVKIQDWTLSNQNFGPKGR